MKEAMTKMRQQSAELALSAQRDAEAAAAEREAAEARLSETQAALEAEQNKVTSVKVSFFFKLYNASMHTGAPLVV